MRSTLFVLSLLSVLFGPWWGILIGATLTSLRYRAYEMVLLGAISDALWLPSELYAGLPLMTLSTLAILWILEPLRKELFIG